MCVYDHPKLHGRSPCDHPSIHNPIPRQPSPSRSQPVFIESRQLQLALDERNIPNPRHQSRPLHGPPTRPGLQKLLVPTLPQHPSLPQLSRLPWPPAHRQHNGLVNAKHAPHFHGLPPLLLQKAQHKRNRAQEPRERDPPPRARLLDYSP